MTQETENFDAIIIGSGQAGNPLAQALAGKGMKTAVVEKSLVGGTCINTGCTPTKAMLASAHAAQVARHSEELGVAARDVEVNFRKVIQRKKRIVEEFRQSSEKSLEEEKQITLIYGTARFSDKKVVEVALDQGGSRKLKAEKIFINTGSRTKLPPLEGLEQVPFLDNQSIMELEELPSHLLIIGGGYIGLEFGQMFRRFGSEVSIFEHGDRLIKKEDADVSEAMADILRKDGIQLYFNSQLSAVAKTPEGIRLSGTFSGAEKSFTGSHLLIATGRAANTEGLQLQHAGVDTDEKGNVSVNDRLETSAEGIYALGDVKGGPQFTHVSYHDYKVVWQHLFGKQESSIQDRIMTYAIFTDPQLGRAGLNEAQAREKGISYKVAKMPMEKAARGIETGHTAGFMKVLIDESNDKIIGASMLCMEGGELASALLIAMMGGLSYQQIRDGMFAHPTLTESLNNLFMSV